jgi:choline kinase
MKTVILAAGTASRLRPITDALPKCLLEVGGKSLLGRALETLASRGLDDIVLVTGYREDQIRSVVRRDFPHLSVEMISNPRYSSTNNIYSLWLTRETIRGHGMLLLDGDILFDVKILDLLLGSGHEDCLAVRTGRDLGREEIKVRVDQRGGVTDIGKDVDPRAALGESIGIELFSAEFVEALSAELQHLVQHQGLVTIFYEAAFQRAIDRGRFLFAVDTGALPCIEIDTVEDLTSAHKMARQLSAL